MEKINKGLEYLTEEGIAAQKEAKDFKMEKYYNGFTGDYLIPITDYTEEIESKVKEFLKTHRDYFLMYLSVDDGYDEDMWCMTNWLE